MDAHRIPVRERFWSRWLTLLIGIIVERGFASKIGIALRKLNLPASKYRPHRGRYFCPIRSKIKHSRVSTGSGTKKNLTIRETLVYRVNPRFTKVSSSFVTWDLPT